MSNSKLLLRKVNLLLLDLFPVLIGTENVPAILTCFELSPWNLVCSLFSLRIWHFAILDSMEYNRRYCDVLKIDWSYVIVTICHKALMSRRIAWGTSRQVKQFFQVCHPLRIIWYFSGKSILFSTPEKRCLLQCSTDHLCWEFLCTILLHSWSKRGSHNPLRPSTFKCCRLRMVEVSCASNLGHATCTAVWMPQSKIKCCHTTSRNSYHDNFIKI